MRNARLRCALALVLSLIAAACTPHPDGSGPRPGQSSSTSGSPVTNSAEPPEPQDEGRGEVALTVMTYNILGGIAPRDWYPYIPAEELLPETRAPYLVQAIRAADPDVIGFQEFVWDSASGRYLREHLAEYTFLDLASGYDSGLPIAVRTERFEVLASGVERVSDRAVGGSDFDRHVSWAELRDKENHRRFYIFDLHAHPWQTEQYARVRSASIDRLIEAMATVNAQGRPLVLLGDFNARSDETRPIYQDHLVTLREAGFVDAFDVAKRDVSDVKNAASMNQMGISVGTRKAAALRKAGITVVDGKAAKVVKRSKRTRHYDYVWVREGTTVRTWGTLSGPGIEWVRAGKEKVPVWTQVVPSDHSPVVADIVLT